MIISDMTSSKLFIEATRKTPEIDFNPEEGLFVLKGKSIPENASKIYEPLIELLKDYTRDPREETQVHFNLMYFNTASSLWIARMIRVLSKINDPEKLLIINLYFHLEDYDEMEEEDIQEAIAPVMAVIKDATVSLGVKVFGTDDNDVIQKERLILF